MALKRWIAGSLMLACILCGCGKQQVEIGQAGSSGSGDPQAVQNTGSAAVDNTAGDATVDDELVDPPLGEDAVSEDAEQLPLSGLVICLDP